MAHIVPRESLCLDCSEYVGQRGTGQGVFKMVLRPAKVDPRFSTQFWCPKNSLPIRKHNSGAVKLDRSNYIPPIHSKPREEMSNFANFFIGKRHKPFKY